MKNTITVIIPFYSGKEWLDEALESVFRQSLLPDEVIVINDGSKENIDDIKYKFRDRVVFLYQSNQGAAAARNYGLQNAHGDLVAFLDSDDLWAVDKLKLQSEFMITNGYKWSATAYETFGFGKKEVVSPFKTTLLCWEHIYNSSRIATPTVMVERDILNNTGFAYDMRKGQDIYLWYKLSNQYVLGVIDTPLTLVRMREGSTSISLDSHIRVRAKLWEKMNEPNGLVFPRRKLTIIGYKNCYRLYRGDERVKETFKTRLVFGVSWLLFRIDNMLLDRKLK